MPMRQMLEGGAFDPKAVATSVEVFGEPSQPNSICTTLLTENGLQKSSSGLRGASRPWTGQN